MKININEIPELVKLVQDEGCQKIRILSLCPTGRALDQYDTIQLDEEDIKNLNKTLVELVNKTDVKISAGFCTRISYPGLNALKGHDICNTARNGVHIDAFGNVYPCTAASGMQILSAGNIQTPNTNLSELWYSSPYFQFLRRFHSNPPEKCTLCTKYNECMSGCRVVIYYKHGDISIADPNCGGPFS